MVVCNLAKFVLFSAVFVARASSTANDKSSVRLPRQSHVKSGQQDQSSAETGFLGGGGIENTKYFQDIYVHRPDPMEIEFGHVFENPQEWEQRYEKKDFNKNRHQGKHLPEHDKYEFGHRRGNEHHVIERYEKAIPHEGQFKTKVRWADKKGGHGEHYWDYNHAGHGGNGGHGGQNDGDRNGGYSDLVPVYSSLQKSPKYHQKRQLEHEKKVTLEDVDSSTPDEKDGGTFTDNLEEKIREVDKYNIQRETKKQKRNSEEGEHQKTAVTDDSQLLFDFNTGKVVMN